MKERAATFPSPTVPLTEVPADHEAGEHTATSDEVLLEHLRAGNLSAGELLIRRYAQTLLRYLQSVAGDDLAEELHQQTWLSVLNNSDKFNTSPGGLTSSVGFKPWLFRIATNKANDQWRSRGREYAAKRSLKRAPETAILGAGQGVEDQGTDAKYRVAIARLPEHHRQILALRFCSNLKFAEIATVLGCPLDTALGRVQKAMTKVQQLIAE